MHKSTIISRMVTQILRLLPTAPSIIPRYTSIGFCFVTATITSAATTSDNATAISRIAHAFPTLIWSLFTIRAKGSFFEITFSLLILILRQTSHHQSQFFLRCGTRIHDTRNFSTVQY